MSDICIKCGKQYDEYSPKHGHICHDCYKAYGKKNAKTIEYLGCSIADFKNYLESLFSDGMNWSNHGNGIGKWNIDHIIPCNAFDLTNEEEQRECFRYKNMGPLWWEENVHKSDKLPDGTRARDIA